MVHHVTLAHFHRVLLYFMAFFFYKEEEEIYQTTAHLSIIASFVVLCIQQDPPCVLDE